MKNILLTLALIFIASCSTAQPNIQTTDIVEPNGNLRIDNNRLYAELHFGDRDTIDIYFDTGCLPGMILPDSIAMRYIDLSELSRSAQFADSDRKIIETENTLYSNLPIKLDSTTVDMAIVRVDNTSPMSFGMGNHSNHRYWSIDYDKMTLSILPDSMVIDTVGGMVWNFEQVLSQVILNVPMTIYSNGNALTTNHKWLLDTGTPYSIAITNPDLPIKGFVEDIPHIRIYDHGTEFLANKRLQYKFYLDSVAFGSTCVFLKQSTAIIDEGWINMMQQFGCMGTIGMDLLKHYNTIIDFKENRVILQPHGRTFDYYSALIDSGLGFHLQPNGMVSQLEVGHSAQLAGLQLDDIIVKVNGAEFNRDELRKVSDGTSLTLTIDRDGQIFEICYTAKKTLRSNQRLPVSTTSIY